MLQNGFSLLYSCFFGRESRASRARFTFADPDTPEGFLLDGKPFQVRSGEMHPSRIPRQYWQQRVRMAKALGFNTIAIYIMWNYHEEAPGKWDFHTGNRDIPAFIDLCEAEGLYVFLRPGPYVCAEWELGGLPAWLLQRPDARLRELSDPLYVQAAQRYTSQIARFVRPRMHDRGGPILLIQIENEYASFGANDPDYLPKLRQFWLDEDVEGPFSVAEGLDEVTRGGVYLPGAALGIDGDTRFDQAQRDVAKRNPVWVGEGYSGWITHWGEDWGWRDYRDTLKLLMDSRRSFNMYMVHGGTNFGWWAGSNASDDESDFRPSVTSYDYGAPINEHGAPGEFYFEYQKIIFDALKHAKAPKPPATPPIIGFAPVKTHPLGSLWHVLPHAIDTVRPQPMEYLSTQTTGLLLYRTYLPPDAAGTVEVTGLHDEALFFLDGKRIGAFSRLIERQDKNKPVKLPEPEQRAASGHRVLEILVFPYGRVNFGRDTFDRKGITGKVTLKGEEVLHWHTFGLPLDRRDLWRIENAPPTPHAHGALFHHAVFELQENADTYLDLSEWKVGFVWVNGHAVGRHNTPLGPQKRLYVPAEWLRVGPNSVIIFDLFAKAGLPIRGYAQSDKEAAAEAAIVTTTGSLIDLDVPTNEKQSLLE